jgi:PKD domain
MNKAVIILSAISFILLFQFASAQVSVANFSMNSQYFPNATITGWINLSINNISSNAYITSSLGQNISLRSLLNLQAPSFNYSCSTSDCNSSYTVTDTGSPYENFSLNAGQSQVFGFLIVGSSPSISQNNAFSLNITSDVGLEPTPQLSVDMLNDGISEWNAYQPSSTVNPPNYGCYSDSIRNSNPNSFNFNSGSSNTYCEEIPIPISAQVNIGANVIGSGNAQFQMTINNTNGTNSVGSCTAGASGTQPISCVATNTGGATNYIVKGNGNFWVCVKQTSGTSSYQINSANPANPCGYVILPGGNFNGTYTIDFQIFGQSVLFAPVGSFLFNDTEIANSGYLITSSNNLEKEITQYLKNKYGDKCPNGCAIPISFYAAQSQDINLTNLSLSITDPTYGTTAISSLYNVAQTPATFTTAGYQSLSLNNAGLLVPNTIGNSTFTLTLYDGSKTYNILSQPISIGQVPQITSVTTSSGSTTTATVITTNLIATINKFNSNATINQYLWNFGDGSPTQTTTNNTVSHNYTNVGAFTLQLTISNSQGLTSTGNFTITALAPKDAVNQALIQDLQNVKNIQGSIANYPSFTQNAINQLLNLNNVSALLQTLQYKNNSISPDYGSIMQALLQINIPQNVQQTTSAPGVPFVPSNSTINLDAVERVGGGTYDATRASDYFNSILAWELNNISMTIDYSEFSGIYGNSTYPILDVVNLNFVGNNPTNKVYLFIPNLNGIYFSNNTQLVGNYYNIPLTGLTQTVQFATIQSFLPNQLPIFISPSLDQISLPQQTPTSTTNKMLILGLILGAIAVVGIGTYILIGKWYQRRYESFLFKDRNDLYNIINYVHSSKNKGLKESDIEKNLRKSKWSGEQIDYVMKRYAGQKVGIPGFKRKK